jgi:hypothetical protein
VVVLFPPQRFRAGGIIPLGEVTAGGAFRLQGFQPPHSLPSEKALGAPEQAYDRIRPPEDLRANWSWVPEKYVAANPG